MIKRPSQFKEESGLYCKENMYLKHDLFQSVLSSEESGAALTRVPPAVLQGEPWITRKKQQTLMALHIVESLAFQSIY